MMTSLLLLILWITSSNIETVESQDGPFWLVVDLDNTLFESKTAYGHADWFYDLFKKEIASGTPEQEAIAKHYPAWTRAQEINHVQAVDPHFIQWIKELQKKKIVVIGLTSRSPLLLASTERQLSQIGLDLSATAPQGILNHPFTAYENGIIFAEERNTKGDVFKSFLTENSFRPSKVIFIDDKERHVENMEKTLGQMEIPFVGIHYTALKEKEPIYNPLIAEFQQQKMEKILSNDEALLLMHHQPDTHL